MIDTTRWRPVIYSETPRSAALYQSFIADKKSDGRRAVLFLIGAIGLQKVAKERARFATVFVFDDLQNLGALTEKMEDFKIEDIATDDNGMMYPKHLTPVELAEVLERQGSLPESIPLLTKVTNALGRRRPSVLETTSRIPLPEEVPESGAHRVLAEVKALMEASGSAISFPVVLDTYVKYLFRIVDRAKVTSAVTKKLPEPAKELWQQALDFASSEIGLAFARAFRSLCVAVDADYRIGHAVKDHGIQPYSGDFVYFVSVLPPFRNCEFLAGVFDNESKPSLPLVRTFKPSLPTPPPKKRGTKKTKSIS